MTERVGIGWRRASTSLPAGVLTNHEFEDKGEFNARPAIRAVFGAGPGCCMTTSETTGCVASIVSVPQSVQGRCTLGIVPEERLRPTNGRWHSRVCPPSSRAAANLATLGWWLGEPQRKFERRRHHAVWPFLRRSDYEAALTDSAVSKRRPSNSGGRPMAPPAAGVCRRRWEGNGHPGEPGPAAVASTLCFMALKSGGSRRLCRIRLAPSAFCGRSSCQSATHRTGAWVYADGLKCWCRTRGTAGIHPRTGRQLQEQPRRRSLPNRDATW